MEQICANCASYCSASSGCDLFQNRVCYPTDGCASFNLEGPEEEKKEEGSVRDHNVGNSDYAKHTIQPWDIWMEYHLNPWDADIVKRILRVKKEGTMTAKEARILDYEKIIHICQERIRQMKEGYVF